MRVVGLTGGIATGKSAVAEFIRALDVPVIDADVVARKVVEPGSPTLLAIIEAFAPDTVLDESGGLDRRAMRSRIARDPHARARLESLTHPEIRRQIEATLGTWAQRGSPWAVVEAALMIETGSYHRYAEVIVVSCSATLQLQRLIDRDRMPEDEARRLIETQLPLSEKEQVATHIIHNNQGLEELQAATSDTWSAITQGR